MKNKANAVAETLVIGKDGLTLGGKPFYLASGDLHYFRIFKDGWRRRLQLMKDFGLTAVQTYVPWNLHEPEEGEFYFEDSLDLAAFLELCDEIGLKVLLRPSGYMCAEWEFGGLPYWLLNKKDLCIRTSDPQFMACLRRYYERLAKEFIPYLSTNGGPIIAVAVENEYGSAGDDDLYIKQLGDMLVELGVDVPLYTANGYEPMKLNHGSRKEYWTGLDLHWLFPAALENIRAYQPDKPILVPEFWSGSIQRWGVRFGRQPAETIADRYRSVLNEGAYANFYMFCGGTNFGFNSGALMYKYPTDPDGCKLKFMPHCTSYDNDAPVNEFGEPTEKYFACKKVLAEYMEKMGYEYGGIETCDYVRNTQAITDVQLTERTGLFDNLDVLATARVASARPRTFESLGQDYGFVQYTTVVDYTDATPRKLTIEGLHDCAYVYGNGQYLGTYLRSRENKPIIFTVPEQGMKLDVLVENMGRVRNGCWMLDEYKGITGFVRIDLLNEDGSIYFNNWTMKTGWENISLPLKDISALDYTKPLTCGPVFLRGTFKAKPGVDTFVNPEGFTKGMIWINGFNLGRYWHVGPQGTLYVPGELLREENVIEVLELYGEEALPAAIRFDDEPSLDTITDPKAANVLSVDGW